MNDQTADQVVPENRPDSAPAAPSSGRSLGLSLSGGGFRATLFHLGVIRALRDTGQLGHVKVITSVSGGSILAAHLVLNWEAYTSDSVPAFTDAAREVIALAQRDIRGRIMHRYPWSSLLRLALHCAEFLPWPLMVPDLRRRLEYWGDSLTAVGLLERQYRRLFGRRRLADLQTGHCSGEPAPPWLYILGSNITTATSCAFSHHGFADLAPAPSAPNNRLAPDLTVFEKRAIASEVIDVAQAVAASSAFPGFFPPVRLRQSQLDWAGRDLIAQTQFVGDAGIYDNLGIVPFLPVEGHSRIAAEPVDCVIVSDATGDVDWDANERMGQVLGSALRTVDLILRHSRDEQAAASATASALSSCFVEIGHIHGNTDLVPGDVQRQLRFVRTDFDQFSDTEVRQLVHHGYLVTLEKLRELSMVQGTPSVPFDTWANAWPLPPSRRPGFSWKRTVDHLRNRRRRRWFRFRPMGSLAYWCNLLLAAMLFIGGPIGWALVSQWRSDRAKEQRIDRIVSVLKDRRTADRPPICNPEVVKSADYLDTPAYSRFQVLDDRRVFDLRTWKPKEKKGIAPSTARPSPTQTAPTVEPTVCSKEWQGGHTPVSVARQMRFKKIAEAKQIGFEFRTTGLEVFLRALPVHGEAGIIDPAQFTVLKDPNHGIVGGQGTLIRQIVLDIASIRLNEEFTTFVEGSYWDAFESPDQRWVGFLSYAAVAKGSILVLFPDSPRIKKFELTVVPQTDVKMEPQPYDGEGFLYAAPDDSFVYWEILNPKWNHVYKISWQW